MTLKPLPSKISEKPVNSSAPRPLGVRRLGFRDGLEFSFGFWVGSLFFFAIVGPVVGCLVWSVLAALGSR